MANNKSIQFLRGTLDKKLNSTDTLFPGQPLFVTDTNQLYMGGGLEF